MSSHVKQGCQQPSPEAWLSWNTWAEQRGPPCQVSSWVTVAEDVAFLDHLTISCALLSQGAYRTGPQPTQLNSTLRLGMGWGKSRGITSLWRYSGIFSKFCLLHAWRQGLAVWEYWNPGSVSNVAFASLLRSHVRLFKLEALQSLSQAKIKIYGFY